MTALRAVTAFLLALHALSHVGLRELGQVGLLLPLLAGVAALLGLAGPGPARDRPQRDRAATYRTGSLWSLYALVASGAFLASASPERELAAFFVGLLALLELLFLAWPAIGPRGVPILTNSLALCTLAALDGGPLAVSAVAGFAPLAAAFAVADHHEQHGAPPHWAVPPMLGHAALAAAATWPLLALLPSARAAGSALPGEGPNWEALGEAWLEIAGWGLLGIVLTLVARKLLARFLGRDGESEPEELLHAGTEEDQAPLGAGAFVETLELSGARARIVRTYEAFLAACRRLGFERRPGTTPLEFSHRLPAPARRLARTFGLARYSGQEPSEDDAERAEADAKTVLQRLRDA